MRRNALNSVALLAATYAGALVAAPAARAADAESLVREGAELEKADSCEAAYLKYRDAAPLVSGIADKGRAAQLQGVLANKLDRLDACYRQCQPTERQRALLDSARTAAETGEPRRATQIARRLLVGKSDKCAFWADARVFLRTLPQQAEEMDADKVDPCEVTAELSQAMTETREAARSQRAALVAFDRDRSLLPKRLPELIELYRAMDATRVRLFELREDYLECDKVYAPLAKDGESMKGSFAQAQELVLAQYKTQLASLTKKVRAATQRLSAQDELLQASDADKDKLKKQLDELSSFNEELYDDLFNFAGAEAISFAVQVEGRRVEQPVEDIHAMMASESKVMASLQQHYPEYFKDGANIEALKRQKLVLEKVGQMMGRFSPRAAQRPGYQRAVDEVQTTIAMMDKAIAKGELAAASIAGAGAGTSSGSLPWFLGGGGALLVAGLTLWRLKSQS